MDMQERFLKLPLWAQNEIKYLQRDLDEAKAHLAVVRGECKDVKVIASLGFNRDQDRDFPLPDDVAIRMGGYEFRLEEDGRVYVWGRETGERGEVSIKPQSGNTFLLGFTPDQE